VKKILFVDDEKNFLEGIRLMLRGHRKEWDCSFAVGAEAALEMTRTVNFDAIVSDVSMPGMSGLDFLAYLREFEATSTVPVVILTGNAEKDLKRKALDLGATDLLSKPVTAEDLVARLRSVLRIGSYQEELRSYGEQLESYNELLEEKVNQRTTALELSRRDIVWRLAKAGEFRDEETGDHVVRVANCSRALATALDINDTTVQSIFLTSPLHDIGKIGIPDAILLKPGGLDAAERKIMESHCEIGAAILLDEPKGMRDLAEAQDAEAQPRDLESGHELRAIAAAIVMSHHEKWDGSGYPGGLQGSDIPLSGRIVALADVYDALRSERPYKKPFEKEKCIAIIEEEKGKHFDPDIVEAFHAVVDEFEEIRSLCDRDD
jgi:putative two-component system response regulator